MLIHIFLSGFLPHIFTSRRPYWSNHAISNLISKMACSLLQRPDEPGLLWQETLQWLSDLMLTFLSRCLCFKNQFWLLLLSTLTFHQLYGKLPPLLLYFSWFWLQINCAKFLHFLVVESMYSIWWGLWFLYLASLCRTDKNTYFSFQNKSLIT